MKPGIQWIILTTHDYTASRDFYRDRLGFTVDREVEKDQFCQFKLESCYLAIFNHENMSKLIGANYVKEPGGAVYSFPESKNIDQDYAELKARGVQFIKEPASQPWGQRTAYFTDPDGHLWELQQWL